MAAMRAKSAVGPSAKWARWLEDDPFQAGALIQTVLTKLNIDAARLL
jgi:hypothetical protein